MIDMTSGTDITSGLHCIGDNHIRIWAGGPEAKPSTCDCGMMKYTPCRCPTCGTTHEAQPQVSKEPSQ